MSRFARTDAKLLGWPCFLDTPLGDVDTCYIVGMYDPSDYDWTLANTARARRRIIKWCGSDAMMLTRPDLLPEATHICDSEMVRGVLLKKGIDARVVECATPLHPKVTPLPEQPTVSVYFGGIPENYGATFVRFLMDAVPDARWHTYTTGQYTDAQMLEVIDGTTVTLRLTSHDGSAAGTREYLEAGRYAITAHKMPHAKQVSLEDPASVVRALKAALAAKEPNEVAVAYYRKHNSAERFLAEFEEVLHGTP